MTFIVNNVPPEERPLFPCSQPNGPCNGNPHISCVVFDTDQVSSDMHIPGTCSG